MFHSYISLPKGICCKNPVQEKCIEATSHDIPSWSPQSSSILDSWHTITICFCHYITTIIIIVTIYDQYFCHMFYHPLVIAKIVVITTIKPLLTTINHY